MKRETEQWLNYADGNFRSAKILLESHLYNPSLQNAQQSIEKNLKAIMIENGLKFQKTHSISTIVTYLGKHGISIHISEDDLDLIDSIYLSSKYPMGSVLPDFDPTEDICLRCIEIANSIQSYITDQLISQKM
jgi:HEPN domain-containing protein